MIVPVVYLKGISTVNLRKNTGNAGPTLSIGANATGIFNDNTDTYTAAATDRLTLHFIQYPSVVNLPYFSCSFRQMKYLIDITLIFSVGLVPG